MAMLPPPLVDALNRPNTLFICLGPDGIGAATPPSAFVPWLDGWIEVDGEPLQLFREADFGAITLAWGRMRESGHASFVATSKPHGVCEVEMFDIEAEFGCFAAVLRPTGTAPVVEHAATETSMPRQAILSLSHSYNIVDLDEAFCLLFGWDRSEVVGTRLSTLIHADDRTLGISHWAQALSTPNQPQRAQRRVQREDQTYAWVEITLIYTPGAPTIRCELLDISAEMAAQIRLQEREQLLQRLTEALPSGVLHIDEAGSPTLNNERWRELTGLQSNDGAEALSGRVRDVDGLRDAIETARSTGLDADLEIEFFSSADRWRHGRLHLRPILTMENVTGLLLTLDDITDQHKYREHLEEQAKTDPLTCALNRQGLNDLCATVFDNPSFGLAALFVDLDGFKAINDSFGHATGDEVLRAVAERITELLRPDDHLARVGGDEFVALLCSISTNDDAYAIANRIRSELPLLAIRFAEPVDVQASVGVAEFRTGDDLESLLARADEAMYRQKVERTGRSLHVR